MNKVFSGKYFIFLFLFSFIFLSSSRFSQDTTGINSPANILSFGNFLFCEKDYLRAIDEYNKYLAVFNDDTVRFKIALCYQGMNSFSESEISTLQISQPSLKRNVYLLNIKNKFLKNDFSGLRRDHDNSLSRQSTEQLYYFSLLMDSSELPDKNVFLEQFPGSLKPIMEKYYSMKMYPGYKSGVMAGLLSAFIPGAGKIYTGNIGDGITATILTGLLSFISYDSFRAGHNFKGWLFTGITAFFYAGNVYGSITAAHQYNEKFRLELDSGLKNFIKENNYFLPEYEINCK